jgi:hypothetical protein
MAFLADRFEPTTGHWETAPGPRSNSEEGFPSHDL